MQAMGQETLSLISKGAETVFGIPEVTTGSVDEWRRLANVMQEQIVLNPLALKLIPRIREGAEQSGLWSDAINLHWEEYLVGKHILGAAEHYAWAPGSLLIRQLGLGIMQRSVSEADDLTVAHIRDEKVLKTVMRRGRFVGELAMIDGNYKEAIAQYQASITNYEGHPEWEERVKGYEIKGFLAEAYMMDGQVKRGVTVAEKAFEALAGEDGAKLDEFTRVVWRSGVVIKACRGLIEQGWDVVRVLSETRLVVMLRIAEQELKLHKRLHPKADLSIRMREVAMIDDLWSG